MFFKTLKRNIFHMFNKVMLYNYDILLVTKLKKPILRKFFGKLNSILENL